LSNPWKGRRLWILLAGIVIVAAAALVGRHLLQHRTKAPAVAVEAAARRDIAVTIEATGVVEPIDLVEVKSKASGQILQMPVQVGSVVRTGDLLAQIDTVDVQNQYEQTLAAERAAQAKVDVSGAGLKRADDLFAQRVITVVEHESATLDFANAEAQLVKARTDFDSARQRRADATVRAPISGTILEQLVSAGQVIVSATSSVSGGTALLRMADLSRIRLRALVSETDIGSVRPGQVATVSVEAFPQRPFEGLVEKVEPQAVVQQSVTMFPVLISISNEDGLLLPGMNGEVSMTVDHRDNVLAVPLDAVRTTRELPGVAVTLGLSADSVGAQIARQVAARVGMRSARVAGGADSSRGRRAGGGGGRPGAGTAYAGGTAAGGPGAGAPGGGNWPGGGAAGSGAAGAGNGGSGRSGRGQAVLVKTARGLEPRLVRIGLSDFDYVEILGGLSEGDEVVLLSVVEQAAKRTQDQTQLRQRLGSGVPGAPAAGGAGRGAGGGR
jgi:HlyD family secretion protein